MSVFNKPGTRSSPLEGALAKKLDAARGVANDEFWSDQPGWLTTVNDAIIAADVSDAEIRAQREWLEQREAEDRGTHCETEGLRAGRPGRELEAPTPPRSGATRSLRPAAHDAPALPMPEGRGQRAERPERDVDGPRA